MCQMLGYPTRLMLGSSLSCRCIMDSSSMVRACSTAASHAACQLATIEYVASSRLETSGSQINVIQHIDWWSCTQADKHTSSAAIPYLGPTRVPAMSPHEQHILWETLHASLKGIDCVAPLMSLVLVMSLNRQTSMWN